MVFRDSNAWAAYPFWFGRPLGKLYRLVVVFQRETEGFAEVPWSAGEIMEIAGAAAGESDISAIDNLAAAQQAALTSAFRGADDIDVGERRRRQSGQNQSLTTSIVALTWHRGAQKAIQAHRFEALGA